MNDFVKFQFNECSYNRDEGKEANLPGLDTRENYEYKRVINLCRVVGWEEFIDPLGNFTEERERVILSMEGGERIIAAMSFDEFSATHESFLKRMGQQNYYQNESQLKN